MDAILKTVVIDKNEKVCLKKKCFELSLVDKKDYGKYVDLVCEKNDQKKKCEKTVNEAIDVISSNKEEVTLDDLLSKQDKKFQKAVKDVGMKFFMQNMKEDWMQSLIK